MPVYTDSILFYDEYLGIPGGGTPFLMGSIGDKITAVININIHWETLLKDFAGSLLFDTTKKTITRADGKSFILDGFIKGDSFTIQYTTSNDGSYVIASITDSVITTVGALVATEVTSGNLYGDTLVTGLDFYYNLVENDAAEDFHSLVDRKTIQKFNATGLNAGGMALTNFVTPTNSKGWIQNGATIDDISFTSHQQKFVITHTFFITPFYLLGQLTNLQKGLPPSPDSWTDIFAEKYIYRFDARYDNLNPVISQTSEGTTFSIGNTAWYNEFLNGFDPEYTLQSIAYTDLSSNPITKIDYTQGAKVTIVLKSANGHFTNKIGINLNSGSAMILNQIYLPLSEDDYVDTITNFQHNFIHDRKLIYMGEAVVNGEKFGTDLQQLTAIKVVFTNANTCTLTYTYNPASEVVTKLNSKGVDNRNYLIWVTPQKNIAIS